MVKFIQISAASRPVFQVGPWVEVGVNLFAWVVMKQVVQLYIGWQTLGLPNSQDFLPDALFKEGWAIDQLITERCQETLAGVHGELIAQADAQIARRQHHIRVQGDCLHSTGGVSQGDIFDGGRVQGDHHAVLSFSQGAHCRGAKA